MLTEAQRARNELARAARRGDPPEVIERARHNLEIAKAEQDVTRMASLDPAVRTRLAVRLLSPGDSDGAA